MQVTATEAKNRFGFLCARAKTDPVIVEREGRPDTVLIGYDEYVALKAAADRKGLSQRRKAFNEKYKDWIAEQHRIVEEHGVFGEEHRVW